MLSDDELPVFSRYHASAATSSSSSAPRDRFAEERRNTYREYRERSPPQRPASPAHRHQPLGRVKHEDEAARASPAHGSRTEPRQSHVDTKHEPAPAALNAAILSTEPPINRLLSKTASDPSYAAWYAFMNVAAGGNQNGLVNTVSSLGRKILIGASHQPALLLGINCELYRVGPRILGRLILVMQSPLNTETIYPGQALVLVDRLFEPAVIVPALICPYAVREDLVSQPVLAFPDMQVRH